MNKKQIVFGVGIIVFIIGFIILAFIEFILCVQNLMPYWPSIVNLVGLALIVIGLIITVFAKFEK